FFGGGVQSVAMADSTPVSVSILGSGTTDSYTLPPDESTIRACGVVTAAVCGACCRPRPASATTAIPMSSTSAIAAAGTFQLLRHSGRLDHAVAAQPRLLDHSIASRDGLYSRISIGFSVGEGGSSIRFVTGGG